MDKSDLIELIKNSMEDLASMPHVAAKGLDLLDKADPSSEDLTKVFEMDMVLTGKLLKIVNSAYYGFSKRVSSVSQAINILGYDNIRNLLITTIALDLFSKNDKAILDSKGLWLHSLAVGTFAQAVARELKLLKPEEFYIAGLLHDVGKVIFVQKLDRDYVKVLETSRSMRTSLYEGEDHILGTNHAEIGYILAVHWKLSSKIASSIRVHHSICEACDDEIMAMAAIIQYSDFLCNLQHIGDSGNVKVTLVQKELKNLVNLSPEVKKKIIEQVKEEIERAKKFFEMN